MDPVPPVSRWQFQLRDLFVATTTLAVGLGLAFPSARLFEWSQWQAAAALAAFCAVAWQFYGAWRTAGAGRIGWRRSLFLVASLLYLPHGWLVVMGYPWSDYHQFWLKLYPVMPGFVVGLLFHPIGDGIEFTIMGVAALLLLIGLSWLARRGRLGLTAATLLGGSLEIWSSMVAYGCFRM